MSQISNLALNYENFKNFMNISIDFILKILLLKKQLMNGLFRMRLLIYFGKKIH